MTSHRSGILASHPTTDQIDAYCHNVIDQHFNGNISEEEARRAILGAVFQAGLHTDVAERRTELTPQARVDLSERLLTLLTNQVLVVSDKPSAFVLGEARRSSVCGALRQYLKACAPSEMRNLRRATNRNGAASDPTSHEFAAAAHSSPHLVVVDAHSAHVDDDIADLVEKFTTRTRGMRETDRVMACAETLCIGLGVEPALRPETMADRDYALKKLVADERLAFESLRALTSLVYGSDRNAVGDVDDRLMSLWDEQSEDSAREILSRPPRVAHMLAIAAVSPLPRPPKKSLQKLKTVIMAGNGLPDKRWRELASALVDSYIASEYEAVSQYATMTDEARKAAVTGHLIARNRLDTLLTRAAQHPGAPLGTNPKRVLSRIVDAADVVFGAEETKTKKGKEKTVRASA